MWGSGEPTDAKFLDNRMHKDCERLPYVGLSKVSYSISGIGFREEMGCVLWLAISSLLRDYGRRT